MSKIETRGKIIVDLDEDSVTENELDEEYYMLPSTAKNMLINDLSALN
jgi:hypothetical protein